MVDLVAAQRVAEEAAVAAGEILLKNRHKIRVKRFKDQQDIVTNVDLKAEKKVLQILSKNFPGHSVFSEEAGLIDHNSPYRWVVDPLDGTKEYFRGVPWFGTCLSLETKKEILVGCVYNPTTDELYSAAKGQGSLENGKRIMVSRQAELKDAFVYTHPPTYKTPKPEFSLIMKRISRLIQHSYRLRTSANDAFVLSWLAKGGVDAYCLLGSLTSWHDVSAGIIIAQEAGARITDIKGKSLRHDDLSHGIVATNGKVHEEIIQLLNR